MSIETSAIVSDWLKAFGWVLEVDGMWRPTFDDGSTLPDRFTQGAAAMILMKTQTIEVLETRA